MSICYIFLVKKEAGSSLDSLENDLIRLKSNPNRTEEEDTLLLLLENELKLYKGTLTIVFCPPLIWHQNNGMIKFFKALLL